MDGDGPKRYVRTVSVRRWDLGMRGNKQNLKALRLLTMSTTLSPTNLRHFTWDGMMVTFSIYVEKRCKIYCTDHTLLPLDVCTDLCGHQVVHPCSQVMSIVQWSRLRWANALQDRHTRSVVISRVSFWSVQYPITDCWGRCRKGEKNSRFTGPQLQKVSKTVEDHSEIIITAINGSEQRFWKMPRRETKTLDTQKVP